MGIVLMAISFVLLAAGLIFKFNMVNLASGLPAAQVVIVRQRMDLIGTILLIAAALTTVLRIGLGIWRVASGVAAASQARNPRDL